MNRWVLFWLGMMFLNGLVPTSIVDRLTALLSLGFAWVCWEKKE